jgi:hypothetical protein
MIKCYLAIVALLFCSNILLAQDNPPAWGGGADQRDLSFGFSFSYVANYYKILKQPNWQTPFLDPENGNRPVTSQLNAISSASTPGFAVGFLTRYDFTEHFELRLTPSLIFADRSLTYTYANPSDDVTKIVQTTTVDFPLAIKIKSDRHGDFRPYFVAGLRYSYSIGAKANSDNNEALIDRTVKNVGSYDSYEAGIGCDIYFEYFKLSPEIKISNSFGNVLLPEAQPFSSPISKLFLHTLMINLYFE